MLLDLEAPPSRPKWAWLQIASVATPNRLPTALWVRPRNLEAGPDEYACARTRRINGRGSQAGPSQTLCLHPPHLPTSSAWRRRCVRRGLPRVLSAGAAHWSLVLEAAAVVAEAPPSAPPPPRSAVAAVVRGLSSGPLRFPPSSAISPSASTSSGAAGNMRLRSRRPASD